uniref:Uncharacterized protein n=1 Tax=Glossina pallidipes TaxID=7398 RepID=A0A1A9ZCR0_GLOPL
MGGGPVLAIVPAVVNIDTLNPRGLRHTPFTHDLSVEQSVSAIHPPTSLTVFVGLHVPLPLLIYPSGHIQIIVRTGAVGVTSHSAGLLHGSKIKQGSTHSSFMHAKRAGQSVSALQSELVAQPSGLSNGKCLHSPLSSALKPQLQGLMHRSLTQDSVDWQSLLELHSSTDTFGAATENLGNKKLFS